MFILVICAGVLIGLVLGGSLRSLAAVPLRKQELLVGALLLQALLHRGVFSGWTWFAPYAPLVHALSYAALAYFLYDQLALPGFRLLGLGVGLNLLVIAVNGFRMPVSIPDQLTTRGVDNIEILLAGRSLTHTVMGPETRLPWLGDVIRLHGPLGPMMASPGDILLWAGVCWFVVAGMTVARRRREC